MSGDTPRFVARLLLWITLLWTCGTRKSHAPEKCGLRKSPWSCGILVSLVHHWLIDTDMPIFTIHIGPSFDGYKLADSAPIIDDQTKQQIFQHQILGESNENAQRMAGGRALRELGRPGWDLAVVDRHHPQGAWSFQDWLNTQKAERVGCGLDSGWIFLWDFRQNPGVKEFIVWGAYPELYRTCSFPSWFSGWS